MEIKDWALLYNLTTIYSIMLIAANFVLVTMFINMQIIFIGDFYYNKLLHNSYFL